MIAGNKPTLVGLDPPDKPMSERNEPGDKDFISLDRPSVLTRTVLYPNHYTWFIFLSALDIMLTWIVLSIEGHEVNVLADWIVQRWGLPGMVIYKFVLVLVVVSICEFVGRRSDRMGRKLAEWAVAITAIPIVLAFLQLFLESFSPSYS